MKGIGDTSTLTYRVGEHYWELEGSDPTALHRSLVAYAPFLCPKGCPHGVEPNFSLQMGQRLVAPVSLPTDTLMWRGIESRIHLLEDGALFASMRMGRGEQWHHLYAERGWRRAKTSLSGLERQQDYFLRSMLTTLYGMSTLPYGTLKLHGALVAIGGRGVLLLGHSGVGKSTHARLWLEHIAPSELIADDEVVLHLHPHHGVMAYPSPWSEYTTANLYAGVKVVAMVALEQSLTNVLCRLSVVQTLPYLLPSISIFRPSLESRKLAHDLGLSLLERIPCYRLECRPDAEATSLASGLLS